MGETAVRAALRSSNWEVARTLGAWGAQWSREDIAAAEGGWHRAQGAAALESGRTAVILGVVGASSASLAHLIDAEGTTALHVCARRGWADGARFLLHARAEPRAKDAADRDPAFVAARHGHHRVLRILMLNGAKAHAVCRDGQTLLMAAAAAGSVKGLAALWEAGAALHATEAEGRTALHH